MRDRVFSIIKFVIGWPLSILALFFIIKLILPQTPTLLAHLEEISVPLLICSIFCFLTYFFIRGFIWKLLVKEVNHDISFKDACFIWASSELKRYIPGNIWSFLGRGMLYAERGVSKNDFIRTTFIEIELLAMGSITVSLLAIPFLSQFFSLPQWIAALAPFVVLILSILYAFHRITKIKHFLLPNAKPTEILFLLLLSGLLFLFFGLGYYFTFISFTAINPNLIWQLAGISVLAFVIGYFSFLTPSGFGVREAALIVALSQIMSVSIAGFLALFARFTFIFAELIFVLVSYFLYKTTNKTIKTVEKLIGEHKQVIILLLFAVIYTVYFTAISSLRFENFYTGKFDLGNMVQTVWNTGQGRFFTFTNPDGTEVLSRLSFHADFILAFLAPFYLLWPDPRNLLFIQTAIVAAGALFIYLIAKDALKNRNLALVFGLVYLFNPSIQRANLYDFHAVTLATTFFLGAFYFLLKKRFWYFLLFAVLAGITKEQVWLIVSLFGLVLALRYKKIVLGLLLFVGSISLSYFLISYAIPHALGGKHFALAYFTDFGDGPIDIAKNIILSPGKTLSTIVQPDRINYLRQLFYPLGYLSVFAPWFLIFAIPDLLINLLSSNTQLHQIYYQYTATISPFLFLAAIYGVSLIKKLLLRINNQLLLQWSNAIFIIYLLVVSLYGAYLYGPLPGAKEPNLDMITKQIEDKEFITQALSQIPSNAHVASSNNLGAHLSNREFLYILPIGVDKADYVVFYLTTSQPLDSLRKDQELAAKLKKDPRYQIVAEKGIFLIFKKISNS